MKNLPKLILITTFIILAAHLLLVMYAFNTLPEEIPVHYNLKGEADRIGSKAHLWAIPAISIVLVSFIAWLYTVPEKLNYPTKDIGERRLVVSLIAFYVALVFLFLTIFPLLEEPKMYIIIFLVANIVLPVLPLFFIFRKRKTS